jgi:hypothetical protein
VPADVLLVEVEAVVVAPLERLELLMAQRRCSCLVDLVGGDGVDAGLLHHCFWNGRGEIRLVS